MSNALQALVLQTLVLQIIVFEYDLGLFLYFLNILVINKGSEGPYLVKLLEVPKQSNNISECARKP